MPATSASWARCWRRCPNWDDIEARGTDPASTRPLAEPKQEGGMSERLVGDLDLGTLRVLHLLLTESSVSAAAARLGRSQPAVSATLRRLRDLLGDPLLVRSGGHLVLTERAHELKPLVQRIIHDLDGLLQTGSGFSPATCCRPVRIFAANCFGAFFLPLIVERLRRAAPHMPLELTPPLADTALHRMLETGSGSV